MIVTVLALLSLLPLSSSLSISLLNSSSWSCNVDAGGSLVDDRLSLNIQFAVVKDEDASARMRRSVNETEPAVTEAAETASAEVTAEAAVEAAVEAVPPPPPEAESSTANSNSTTENLEEDEEEAPASA